MGEHGPSAAMADGAPSRLDLMSQLIAAQAANDAQAATIKSQAAAMEAMAAKIKSLESEVLILQWGRVVNGQTVTAPPLAPSATDSTSPVKEDAPFLLLLLPPDVLVLVASKVVGKTALCSTCRSLRLAVNACTSKLTWSGGPRLRDDDDDDVVAAAGGGAPPYLTLHLALPAAPQALQLLNCSGQPDKPFRIYSLAGCPPSVHTLICSHTLVSDLGPLAACSLLHTLDCSNTKVAELGPLAACKMLHTLNCSNSVVAELGPLAAYTLLNE